MNIVIAGKNNIAVNVTEWILNNIKDINVYAIFNKNDFGIDHGQRSFKKFCHDKKIKEISLNESYQMEDSIFLSLEFDRIVKPALFSHEKIFNIHFSSLPKYKGMFTSAWPILNNESYSGVTLHKIDSGIDTGPIIAQKDFKLDYDETAKSLYLKYIKLGTELVISNIERLLDDSYTCTQQSSENSSYYSRTSINYESIKIDLNKTAFEIIKQINAFTFRDYQLPVVHGVCIYGGSILKQKSTARPGVLVESEEKKLKIATIDYDVELYKDNFDDILEVCKFGTVDELKKIVCTDRILIEKNEKGWSPIIVAAYNGNIDLVRWLVDIGADINDRNNNGTTVIMYYKDYMARSREFSRLKELIKLGADLSLADHAGKTVFDYINNSSDSLLINAFDGFRK